jgi:hypothetical protein
VNGQTCNFGIKQPKKIEYPDSLDKRAAEISMTQVNVGLGSDMVARMYVIV